MSGKNGAPPAYPPPIHQDAGPVNPSPYNQYGGFNNPSQQQFGDPRGAGGYGSPAPGGYGPGPYGPPAPQQGYYGGPPGGPGPQQQMYYGPPGQQPYYNNGPGPYGGHPPYSQYQERREGQSGGICAGIMGALACCCCLDLLF